MAFRDMEPTTCGNWEVPLAEAAEVEGGEFVCANTDGWGVPGAAAADLRVIGVAKCSKSNADGEDGDASVIAMTSIDGSGGRRLFPFLNDGTNPVTQAHVQTQCYIAGPNSVTSLATARSIAGKVWGFDTEGNVMVEIVGGIAAADVAGLQSDVTDLQSDVTALQSDVSDLETDVAAIQLAAPGMQAVNATLSSGTIAISTGITVAANSEVVGLIIGDITGSTNFGCLRERKASRVNGAPGTGSVTVDAVGSDGLLDADAAGAIRVLIFTPLA